MARLKQSSRVAHTRKLEELIGALRHGRAIPLRPTSPPFRQEIQASRPRHLRDGAESAATESLLGQSIPRFHLLRKMRLSVPGLNVGKRGGYRLIYRAKEMDEAVYVVFLEAYFKGDCEDLDHDEYKTGAAPE